MEQEHRITYKAGITRSPSDFLCSDGELAECINLTTDNEELKPIVQPAEYITNYVGISGNHRPVLVYVHKVANRDNYIGYLPTNGNRLCSGTVSDRTYNNFAVYNNVFFEPGTSKITSVGKTLILTDSNGMRYLLWNPDRTAYKDLKYKLPELDFSARIHIRHSVVGPLSWVSNSGKASGIIEDFSHNRFEIADDKQEDYNDLVVGLYEKNLRSISQKKGFSKPFLLRAALELYDGSYYYISNPTLLFPSVTINSFLLKRELGE